MRWMMKCAPLRSRSMTKHRYRHGSVTCMQHDITRPSPLKQNPFDNKYLINSFFWCWKMQYFWNCFCVCPLTPDDFQLTVRCVILFSSWSPPSMFLSPSLSLTLLTRACPPQVAARTRAVPGPHAERRAHRTIKLFLTVFEIPPKIDLILTHNYPESIFMTKFYILSLFGGFLFIFNCSFICTYNMQMFGCLLLRSATPQAQQMPIRAGRSVIGWAAVRWTVKWWNWSPNSG